MYILVETTLNAASYVAISENLTWWYKVDEAHSKTKETHINKEVYPAYPIDYSTERTEKIVRMEEMSLQMHARSSKEVHPMAEQSDLGDRDSPL